jgi:hypothetical protein
MGQSILNEISVVLKQILMKINYFDLSVEHLKPYGCFNITNELIIMKNKQNI